MPQTCTGVPGTAIVGNCSVPKDGSTVPGPGGDPVTGQGLLTMVQGICDDLATIRESSITVKGAWTYSGVNAASATPTIASTGGAGGPALAANAGTGNVPAIIAAGSGSREGISCQGGLTGPGIVAQGGVTSGNGIDASGGGGNSLGGRFTGSGSQPGISATGGSSGGGIVAVAGGGNTAGLDATGGGSGVGVKGTAGGTAGTAAVWAHGGPVLLDTNVALSTTAPPLNTQWGSNTVNFHATLVLDGSGGIVVRGGGYNCASAGFGPVVAGHAHEIDVVFATPMADAAYTLLPAICGYSNAGGPNAAGGDIEITNETNLGFTVQYIAAGGHSPAAIDDLAMSIRLVLLGN